MIGVVTAGELELYSWIISIAVLTVTKILNLRRHGTSYHVD